MQSNAETPSSGGLFTKVIRGAFVTALGYGGSQALRLVSNLILTRLLFPEAFGLMALVSVFMIGLVMFSDVGIGPSIAQNKRGDDPEYLDTAYTIQAVRGFMLWIGTCAAAYPVAQLYEAPDLVKLLPVAGLSLFIGGFNPTRIETAHRHLALGRVTMLDMLSQVIGTGSMILLSWATGSVWSLVIGGIIGALAKLWLMDQYLPGPRNRFRWEPEAARELMRFGKWIFLSTACGFLLAQGDRAILGRYLTLDVLGIYNIGFFLASFPALLGSAIMGRVLIPLYREVPPTASKENRARLRRMRFVMSALLMGMVSLLAMIGVPLVALMYDQRYQAAGAMVVLITVTRFPKIVGLSYDMSALAAGDSRSFFWLSLAKAVIQTSFFIVGAEMGGLLGALIAQGIAYLAIHPFVIWLARRHCAWDPLHDFVFGLAGLVVAIGVILHHDELFATLAGL